MLEQLTKIQKGIFFEETALCFLKQNGLKLIAQNYHTPCGEIDLIMQDQIEIVFIEVRFRKASSFGNALESVDTIKQQKLLKSADYYLHQKNLTDTIDCRFDIIGFSDEQIEWIKDAFSYE